MSTKGTLADPISYAEACRIVMLGELSACLGRPCKPPAGYAEPEAALWRFGHMRKQQALCPK